MTRSRRAANGAGTIRRKPTGRYEGQFRINGRRVSISGATPADVLRRFAERTSANAPLEATVADALAAHQRHLDARLAAGTLRQGGHDAWRYAIARCADVAEVPLCDLTPALLESWISALECAPSTRRQTWLVLAAACETAVRDGLASATFAPFAHLRSPSGAAQREAAHASASDVAVLLAAAQQPWRTLWTVLAYTGLRPGEGRTMRWEHVDLVEQHVIIPNAHAKTSATVRLVALVAPVSAAIKTHWLACGRPDTGLLFAHPSDPQQPVTRWMTARAFRRAAPAGLTPHSLRHGVATRLLASGIPAHEVAAVLGHSSPTVTMQIYAHSIPRARRSALETLMVDRLVD